MKLVIYIGRINHDGLGKFKRLKLGDPVGPNDIVVDETIRGLRCIRAVAVLTAKEAGKRKVKTWTFKTVAPNAAGEDIRKACEAEADKWKAKVMAEINGSEEAEEQLTQVEL